MLNASDPSAFYQVDHMAAKSTGRSKGWGGGDRIEPLLPLPQHEVSPVVSENL